VIEKQGLDFWPRLGFLLSLLRVHGILGPSGILSHYTGAPIRHKTYVYDLV